MANKDGIYKCSVCGNVVEVLTAGVGELVCCGKPMELQVPNTVDASTEKHLPVLEVTSNGDLVKVGSVAHPMTEEHYIEWIAVKTTDSKIGRRYLKPGDAPEALFEIESGKLKELWAYCNIHGLWKSEVN